MALSNALNFAGRWHIVDWAITIAVWIAYFIIASKATPYHSDLLLDGNNMPLGHTYDLVDESVPDSALILYSILLPALVILATHALQFRRKRIQAVNDAIGNICGLLLGCGANLILTETLKMVFGQPRPNFAALCKWDAITKTCTGSSKDIKNAYSSFPSAHASFSFCGLVYLSLTLAYYWSCRRVSGAYEPHPPCNEPQVVSPKVYVSEFQQRPADSFSTIISALFLSPIWLACYISVTRVVNKYHFTVDILAGAVIGTGFAFWAASCKLRSLWITLLKSQAGLTDTNSDVRLDNV